MSAILDSIRAAVGSAFTNIFDAATLYRITVRASDGRGGYAPVYDPREARALVDDYSTFLRGSLGIPAAERKIIILGASCNVEPMVGDVLTAQGASWEVIEVKRDPAAATYECRSKPAPTPTRIYAPNTDELVVGFTDDDGLTNLVDDDGLTNLADDFLTLTDDDGLIALTDDYAGTILTDDN